MNKSFENEFLCMAIRLADEILQNSEKNELGLKWKTFVFEYPDQNKLDYSVDLYSGVSGISFFFLELYKKTKTTKYLDIAKQAVNWVIDSIKKTQSTNYAFYSGILGVCWLLSQIYKITGEENYLKDAIEFALPCADVFLNTNQFVNNGFIEGRAGSLLALLHIYQISEKEEILQHIDKFINKLIQDIRIRPKGISWLFNEHSIKPLTSFSFGNSGIAFVFLELGKYFGNQTFFQIAEQAFVYENSLWSDDIHNWPDFRKEIKNANDFRNFKSEFRNNNLDFFLKPNDNISLAHGTVGIGLTRLRAYEILKNPIYQDDINKVLSKIETNRSDHDRFEGEMDKAIFYFHAWKSLNNNVYFEEARKIVKELIVKKNDNLDCSLFKGKSGIAYLALLLSDKTIKSSIFLPSTESICKIRPALEEYPFINIKSKQLRNICFKNRFYRTSWLIDKIDHPSLKAKYEMLNIAASFYEIENFKSFIEHSSHKQLKDCYYLEYEEYLMEIAIQSNILLHVKEALHQEDIQLLFNLSEEQFLNMELMLNYDVKIIKTGWNWISEISTEVDKPIYFTDNLEKEKAEFESLIYPVSEFNSIVEKKLTVLSTMILEIFEKPKLIKKAAEEFLESFEIECEDEIPVIKKMAIDYIVMFVEKGVLIFKKS